MLSQPSFKADNPSPKKSGKIKSPGKFSRRKSQWIVDDVKSENSGKNTVVVPVIDDVDVLANQEAARLRVMRQNKQLEMAIAVKELEEAKIAKQQSQAKTV